MAQIVNCSPNPPEKSCFTIKEFAAMNRVEPKTVERWIARGIVNYRRFGRTVRIYGLEPISPPKKHDPAYS
jgi:hypothetical protein